MKGVTPMGLLKRFFRLFRFKAEDHLAKHEDDIRIYEDQLKKSKDNISQLGDSKARLRAERNLVQDKHRKAEKYIIQLEEVLNTAAEQKDFELGERTMGLIESNQRQLEIHDLSIQKYDGVIQELEKQHAHLKEQYRDKEAALDGLRAQQSFVKNMETINMELKNNYSDDEFDFNSFNQIEEKLRGKIYLEQEKNKDYAPKPSIEQMVNTTTRKSRFEELVQLKEAEKQGLPAPEAEKKREAVLLELKNGK